MKPLRWIGVGLAIFAVTGCAFIAVSGSAIVHDKTGDVTSAFITNDRVQQSLQRLPGGTYFGVPNLEGVIEVRCRDGSKAQAGYVTSGMHTSVTAVSSKPCRLVEKLAS